MARWRGKNLGIVFQFFQLLPTISVIENIMLPMDFCRTYPMRERETRALAFLEMVELGTMPTNFRRLFLAVNNNAWRLHAHLQTIRRSSSPMNRQATSIQKQQTVFSNCSRTWSHKGKTIIIVTHDSALAKRTHRTALIADGEIVNEYVAKAMPTLITRTIIAEATHDAKEQHYEAGTMIFRKARTRSAFYIVTKGTVEVVLPRANQSDVVAVQLGPGKYFGEMEFFHEKKHRGFHPRLESGPGGSAGDRL